MDVPSHGNHAHKLQHSKSYSGSSHMGYSTYAVPRGVNGTPPSSRAIPPAIPPRKKCEGEVHSGSLGSSPSDKGGIFSSRLRPNASSEVAF